MPTSTILRLQICPRRSGPSLPNPPRRTSTQLALSTRSNTSYVYFNPIYDQLYSPTVGPSYPYNKYQGFFNHKLGFVENANMDTFTFDEQYNTCYVGDVEGFKSNDGISVYNMPQHLQKKRKLEKKKEKKHDMLEENDEGDEEHAMKKKKKKRSMDGGEREKEAYAYADKTSFHGKEEKDYQGRS